MNLAEGALINGTFHPIPIGPAYEPIGRSTSSFGIKGKPGFDNLVVFASGQVEGHNDNTGNPNADDVYLRLQNLPPSYTFQMQ